MVKLQPLKQQVMVITGASSGIGLVTARMAARHGVRLVLAARNSDALHQLADEINREGGQAVPVPTDVGKLRDMERLAETAMNSFGGFDSWVNNAGISIFGPAYEVSIEDMERMFATTFWGVVYGSRLAAQHFMQRGRAGAIINIGSLFGDRATAIQSTYSAAKHAVHGWTDALRMDLEAAHAPVSVTLIHPGRIDTPYNEHARNYYPQQVAHIGMIYPPEAVAEAILYAAEHPVRDVFVGSQAKAVAVGGAIAPRLMDKVMERYMFATQLTDRPAINDQTNALYRPGYGMQERGSHEGWHRSSSMYVKATKNPALATLATVGAGEALLALISNLSQNGSTDGATQASKVEPIPIHHEEQEQASHLTL
jgi:short-subunit dehydrogenase